MKTLERKTGTVLFIDILGMSALTTNEVTVLPECYEAWKIIKDPSPQMLAAKILSQFRENLHNIINIFGSSIEVAQLSDCAFLWSEDAETLLKASHNLMILNLETCILSRGAIAYGEIIISHSPYNFGKFIVGDAATKAAKLESKCKGMRILLDDSFIENITAELKSKISIEGFSLINQIRNEFSNELVNEFIWYIVDKIELISEDLNSNAAATKYTLKIIKNTLINPKIAWNLASPDGTRHVDCFIAGLIAFETKLRIFCQSQSLLSHEKTLDNLKALLDQTRFNPS